jgi:hypothetical protein
MGGQLSPEESAQDLENYLLSVLEGYTDTLIARYLAGAERDEEGLHKELLTFRTPRWTSRWRGSPRRRAHEDLRLSAQELSRAGRAAWRGFSAPGPLYDLEPH